MNKYTLVMLLSLILLGSCKFLFESPSVRQIHDLKVLSFSPSSIEIELSLEVTNPNRYNLKLEKLQINLLNKDRMRIGVAEMSKPIEIPGKKSNSVDFSIKLDTRQVVRLIGSTKSSVLIYIEGFGKGNIRGVSKSFDFEIPYELEVKKHIQEIIPNFRAEGQELFKVLNTSMDNVSLAETTVKIDFLLLNPYGLSFELSDFDAELYINNKAAGVGNLVSRLTFDEKTFYREGELVFKVSNLKSILGAAKGLLKGEIAYEVKGNIKLNVIGIPIMKPYVFKGSFPLSLSKLLLGL